MPITLRRSFRKRRAVAGISIDNVVDVGVYKGGSIVLLNEAFRPRRRVSIDSNPADAPPLREYCNTSHRKGRIGVYLGVNQVDRVALAQICGQALNDEPIDLVVDDASQSMPISRVARSNGRRPPSTAKSRGGSP